MLGEYWDRSVSEPGFEQGGNKLLDTRYQRSEGPFYHGTAAALQVGEVIQPQQATNWQVGSWPSTNPRSWGEFGDNGSYAFATGDVNAAQWYAAYDMRRQGGNTPGYVYQVEPVQPDHHYDPDTSGYPENRGERGGTEGFRSASGWRVVGLVQEIPANTPLNEDFWTQG